MWRCFDRVGTGYLGLVDFSYCSQTCQTAHGDKRGRCHTFVFCGLR
jgi:hypothetical protein